MGEENFHDYQISFSQQILASSSGALITSLLVTPMDVVKTRLQRQVRPLVDGECFLYSNGLMDHICRHCRTSSYLCNWYNRPGHFNGTIDAIVKIAKSEGMSSLWSGLLPTITIAIPSTVFYFTLYDNLHSKMVKRYGNRYYLPLFAGTLSRGVVVCAVSPIELVRTKIQSERLSYNDLLNSMSRTIMRDGPSSLWRGCSATLMRDMPFSAIYWTFYEFLKSKITASINTEQITFAISFVSGAISGGLSTILTQPFDVVKTHRQITLDQTPYNISSLIGKREVSTFSSIKKIVRNKGPSALFAGLVPRATKVSFACALMISTYEILKSFFHSRNKPN